jgi:hypothetical protein
MVRRQKRVCRINWRIESKTQQANLFPDLGLISPRWLDIHHIHESSPCFCGIPQINRPDQSGPKQRSTLILCPRIHPSNSIVPIDRSLWRADSEQHIRPIDGNRGHGTKPRQHHHQTEQCTAA